MSTQFMYQSERMGKSQYQAFFAALIGWIFDYYEVFLLSFVIIPMSKALGLTTGQTAALESIQLAGLALGGMLFGILGDRIGRKGMLMYTVILYGVGTLMRAFSFDFAWLVIWTGIAGFGIGGEYGVGQALVSEVVPTKQRGFWSGLLYGGIFIGIAGGAVVGGYVLPAIGWRWTFALSAIPALLAAYIRGRIDESDVWEKKVAKRTTPLRTAKFGAKRFWLPFVVCLIASVFQFFAYYGITTFLPTYLVKNEGFSMGHAAWWLFFTAFAGLVGAIVGGYTADKWGRRITLCYLGFIAALGGLWLFLSWHTLLHSQFILVPFFLLYFGSNGATVFGSLFSEMFPTDIRSTGVSWSLQIGRGLAFIPPLITAALYPVYGYKPIILIGAAEFFALGLWAWVFRETKNLPLDSLDEPTGGEQDASSATVQA